jgi:hypothetical protein
MLRYRAIGAMLLVLPLAACTSLSIPQPPSGQQICGTVSAEVDWSSDLQGSLTVLADGNNVSQQFAVDSVNRKATAALVLPEGPHSLNASGNFSCWYCGGASALAASSNFTTHCPKK